MKITEQTKIPFSRHKGTKLRDLPDGFLSWAQQHLKDTDFHDWSVACEDELSRRQREGVSVQSLELQADEFLRNAGYNPRHL